MTNLSHLVCLLAATICLQHQPLIRTQVEAQGYTAQRLSSSRHLSIAGKTNAFSDDGVTPDGNDDSSASSAQSPYAGPKGGGSSRRSSSSSSSESSSSSASTTASLSSTKPSNTTKAAGGNSTAAQSNATTTATTTNSTKPASSDNTSSSDSNATSPAMNPPTPPPKHMIPGLNGTEETPANQKRTHKVTDKVLAANNRSDHSNATHSMLPPEPEQQPHPWPAMVTVLFVCLAVGLCLVAALKACRRRSYSQRDNYEEIQNLVV